MVNFLFSRHHLFDHLFSFFIIIIHIYTFVLPLPTYIFIFILTVHAGCLYVTDTLSTPGSFYSMPDQMYVWSESTLIPSKLLSNEVQVLV